VELSAVSNNSVLVSINSDSFSLLLGRSSLELETASSVLTKLELRGLEFRRSISSAVKPSATPISLPVFFFFLVAWDEFRIELVLWLN
jgi:hypothetical protein